MDEDLQRQLDEIKQIFISELDTKLEKLESLWARILENRSDQKDKEELHLVSHSLVGSSATFGFESLSAASRKLEQSIKPHAKQGEALAWDKIEAMKPLVDAVERQILSITNVTPEPQQDTLANNDNDVSVDKNLNLVYTLIEDQDLLADLEEQLTFYGISIQSYDSLDAIKTALQSITPKANIIDIKLISSEKDGRTVNPNQVPTLFLADNTHSFKHQLLGIKAGGVGYFKAPIDAFDIVEKLEQLDQDDQIPFRVLIVEDEVSLSKHYALTLENAGMRTKVVNCPCDAIDALTRFSPDVILMDLYMPECTGIELAKVIRQDDTFSGIPIMYLSAESNIEKQTEALSQGADDFLHKPIQPEHLVLSVKSRAERYQVIRNIVIRDSLTGLLNHSHIKEQIINQVHAADRQKSTACFAMIDIDHFKSVNDLYGHLQGDKVIKSLAHLLKRRLRKTDVIGRMGGEEFGIVLPNTSLDGAIVILEEIRDAFANITHQSGDTEFSVTFSCGIAEYPGHDSISAFCDATDKALYKAKHEGRNQIQIVVGQIP